MATTFGTEDFIVDANKKSLIEKLKKKIERVFQVTVSFDAISKDGDDKKQWVVVSGSKAKRRNAKNYILAMCYPEQTTQVTCQGSVALDDVILEEVEQTTSAFLQQTGSFTLDVRGNELSCALAVSQLEQTYSVIVRTVTSNTDDAEPSINSKEMPATGSSTTDVSNRVQTLSVDGVDGSYSSDSSFESAQLFASGSISGAFNTKAPRHQFHIESPEVSPQTTVNSTFTAPISVPRNQTGAGVFSKQPKGNVLARPGTGSLENKLTSNSSSLTGQTKFSLNSVPSGQTKVGSSSDLSGQEKVSSSSDWSRQPEEKYPKVVPWKDPPSVEEKQKAYFMKISLNLGYSESDIQETLQFFDFSQQSVENHEFMTALEQVRANNQNQKLQPHASSSSRNTAGDSTKPAKKEKKKGMKLQENIRHPSPSQSKVNRGKSPAKHLGGASAASSANSQMGNKKGGSSTGDSGVYDWENTSKSSQVPSASADDSVICMGEDALDDSVCIVDAYPVAGGAAGQPAEDLALSSSRSSRKRKDYSDDEEQTFLMKPYSSVQPVCRPKTKMQEADLVQGVTAASTVTEPSPPRNVDAGGDKDNCLRYVVIDGSNVAMSHGNDKVYSCRGIRLCVDYFVKRGHRVKAFVPLTKTYKNQTGRFPPMQNQEILDELKEQGYLEFTPARTLNNKHIVSHDDYFILNLAQLEDAVIVTRDNFREFVGEFQHIIENRLLSYVFSDDHFMLPRDPLGRYGPTLEEFLRKPPSQNSTHSAAARTNQREAAVPKAGTDPPYPAFGRAFPAQQPRIPAVGSGRPPLGGQPKLAGHISRLAQPPSARVRPAMRKRSSPTPRHPDTTFKLLTALKTVFPEKEQEEKIQQVLENHVGETDLNKLTNYCISALSL